MFYPRRAFIFNSTVALQLSEYNAVQWELIWRLIRWIWRLELERIAIDNENVLYLQLLIPSEIQRYVAVELTIQNE